MTAQTIEYTALDIETEATKVVTTEVTSEMLDPLIALRAISILNSRAHTYKVVYFFTAEQLEKLIAQCIGAKLLRG